MGPFNPRPVCSTEVVVTKQQHATEVAALEAQIADLKQLVALLQSQLGISAIKRISGKAGLNGSA